MPKKGDDYPAPCLFGLKNRKNNDVCLFSKCKETGIIDLVTDIIRG